MTILRKYGSAILYVLILLVFGFGYWMSWQNKIWTAANINVLMLSTISMIVLGGMWAVFFALKREYIILFLIPILILIKGEVVGLIGLVVWFLANHTTGMWIKDFLIKKKNSLFQIFLAQFLGMGVNAYLVWGIMHFPINYSWVYYLIFVFEIVLFRKHLIQFGKKLQSVILEFKPNWEIRIVLFFIIYFLVYSLSSYYNWDDIAKHLFIAKQTYLQGVFDFDPRYVVGLDTSIIAQNSYVSGYMLGGEMTDRLINLMMFACGWLVLADFWRNKFGNGSILGILLLIITPFVLWQIDISFIDSFNFFSLVVILIVFYKLIQRIKGKYLTLYFILAGLAFLTKQQSVFFLIPTSAVLTGLILIRDRKYIKHLLVGIIASIMIVLPILGTNYAVTANPFYPYMNKVFQSDYLTSENIGDQWKKDTFPPDFVYDITFNGQDYIENHAYSFGISYVMLIWFIPVIIIDKKRLSNVLLILTFAVGVATWFFVSGPYMRYFVALMPLGATLITMTIAKIQEILDNKYMKGVFVFILAPVVLLNFLCMTGISNVMPTYPITNLYQKDVEFVSYQDIKKSFEEADKIFENNNKGLLVESPALYFANTKIESLYWYHWKNYEEIATSGLFNEELRDLIFKKKEFDYIVIPNTDNYGLFTEEFLTLLKPIYKGNSFSAYINNEKTRQNTSDSTGV